MKYKAHIGIIHNKYAGTRKKQHASDRLRKLLEDEFSDVTYIATTSVEKEKWLAIELCNKLVDIIIVLGGDGSIHHTINGLMEYPHKVPPFTVFPSGSGNDFSRSFKIKNDMGKFITAIKYYLSRESTSNNYIHSIDIGKIKWIKTGEIAYFANSIGMGMDAEIVKYVQRLKQKTQSSYLKAIWKIFRVYDFPMMQIQLDGHKLDQKCTFVLTCNGKYAGGKMLFAPHAEPDDGYLDTIIVSSGFKPLIMLHLPLLYLGWHIYSPIVKSYKSKYIKFNNENLALQMDGESYQDALCEITIAEKKLKFLVP